MQGRLVCAGDGLEMLVKPFLRRFVVVGHHQQQPVHTLLLGLHAELDAFRGVVVTGAGNHRAAVADGFLHLGEQPQLLFGAEGGRLAGGTRDDDSVAAGVEEGVGEALGLIVVHLPLGVERCNHSRDQPAYLCHDFPPTDA